MDNRKRLQYAVNNIRKTAPLLIVGDAVTDFMKAYKGPIRSVRTVEDTRDLVSYYTSMGKIDKLLVIEDLSYLTQSASFLLLKLVEEAQFPIILLSTFDKVSPIILSRVKMVVKYSTSEVKSDFLNIKTGLTKVEDELSPDSHYYDRIRYIGKYSPKLFYYNKALDRARNKDKIFDIIGGDL